MKNASCWERRSRALLLSHCLIIDIWESWTILELRSEILRNLKARQGAFCDQAIEIVTLSPAVNVSDLRRFGNLAKESKQPIENCKWMRRTARNKKINRQLAGRAVMYLRGGLCMVPRKWRRHQRQLQSWFGNSIIGFPHSQSHVLCYRTGYQKTIGVSRRSNKLNTETSHVPCGSTQDVRISLTCVTSTCRNLSQLQ